MKILERNLELKGKYMNRRKSNVHQSYEISHFVEFNRSVYELFKQYEVPKYSIQYGNIQNNF